MSDAAENVTPIDRAKDEVTPIPKAGKANKAPAAKKTAAKKSPPPAKAAKAAKKDASGIQRSPSTISKEGTQKDAFTGEELPVTAFPTIRQKDGSYTRGEVARKNLEAYRANKKAEREAAKAQAAAAKEKATAEKKAAKEAEKAAAKEAPKEVTE